MPMTKVGPQLLDNLHYTNSQVEYHNTLDKWFIFAINYQFENSITIAKKWKTSDKIK